MTTWLKKFFLGCVPIAAALLVMSIPKRRDGVIAFIGLNAVAAVVLWIGRGWIRQTLATRLLALAVWLLVAIVLASGALVLAIALSAPLFIVFVAGFAFLCYDLMFRQPQLGKAKRESAGYPAQS